MEKKIEFLKKYQKRLNPERDQIVEQLLNNFNVPKDIQKIIIYKILLNEGVPSLEILNASIDAGYNDIALWFLKYIPI